MLYVLLLTPRLLPGHAATETSAELSLKLAEAERKIEALEAAYTDQAQLVTAYENGIHDTAERLRNFMYEQQQATIGTDIPPSRGVLMLTQTATHAHYNALLEASRNETLQAQLTHQAWQASVSRVAEGVGLAYREESDKSLPYRRRIAALKEENRLLRIKAGWDPPTDSSEDEEQDEDEGKR